MRSAARRAVRLACLMRAPAGEALIAISDAQSAAQAVFSAGEATRGAISRGLPDEIDRAHAAAAELAIQTIAACRAARRLRRALRVAAMPAT